MVSKHVDRLVYFLSGLFFTAAIIILLVGLFWKPISGEAYVGSFEVKELNDDWELFINGHSQGKITLPYDIKNYDEKEVIISRVAPHNVSKGMRMLLRTKGQAVRVYLDNNLRVSYGYGQLKDITHYPPDAYVSVALGDSDFSKTISIKFDMHGGGVIDEIHYGYGDNVWFMVLKENLATIGLAVFMIIIGISTMIVDGILRRSIKHNKITIILGQILCLIGIWVVCESKLRQLIFRFPSVSIVLPYITLSVFSLFVVFYVDEAQDWVYHKDYTVFEIVLCIQFIINILLQAFLIMPMQDSVHLLHFWMILGMCYAALNMVKDREAGRLKKYSFISVGLAVFFISATVEIVAYYMPGLNIRGIPVCVGGVGLLVSYIVQTIKQTVLREKERAERLQKDALATIETIAGSIDAKDEYTGGHSERVAEYANILAMEIADEYNLSDEDILRINYNALLHDIGKIGVPDVILNKFGALSDDEYQLIKRHTIIGDDLIHGAENINYLSEGIRYHHERYDGRGYPEGLKGEEIPLVARILCIADSYDAMTSNRVYRSHLTDKKVRDEILRCAGTQFDPHLAEVFCRLIDEGRVNPHTMEGMEVTEDGKIRKSALLRQLLTDNIVEGRRKILNPTFVTMVTYITKIEESAGKSIHIYLVGVKGKGEDVMLGSKLDDAKSVIKKAIDKYVGNADINIDYSTLKRLVVWVGAGMDEIASRIDNISALSNDEYDVTIEEIG